MEWTDRQRAALAYHAAYMLMRGFGLNRSDATTKEASAAYARLTDVVVARRKVLADMGIVGYANYANRVGRRYPLGDPDACATIVAEVHSISERRFDLMTWPHEWRHPHVDVDGSGYVQKERAHGAQVAITEVGGKPRLVVSLPARMRYAPGEDGNECFTVESYNADDLPYWREDVMSGLGSDEE